MKTSHAPLHRRAPVLVLLAFFFNLLIAGVVLGQTITAYDCWGNLGFEGQVNISFWSANGTAVTFTNDSAQAHSGTSALHIDGTSPISIWGGRVAGTVLPATGDSVGGSFWIKVLAAPTGGSSVDVRMTAYDSSNAETIYCHTSTIDVSTLPLNTWVQVNLTPTSSLYNASYTAGFNIISSGGINCLVDDITFGKVTAAPPGPVTGQVSAGVVPHYQEYVGSAFNGNFEIGNATVGNQYWGQYIPNQAAVAGSPNMMTLITSAASTPPGATVNGSNMVSIARGGVAWNIGALSTVATDKLARVGDQVGGSYWIYVPANADLTLGVPSVYFACQTAGGDITVADASAFPATSLQKGKWNEVPIYPNATNSAVLANATGTAIMITAPALNSTTNPLYAAPFYIDNIRVGKIPTGLFITKATGLTDASGNALATLGANDTTLYTDVIIQNSQNSATTSACVVLKLYQQGVLKSTAMKAVTINAKGATGVSFTSTTLSAPLDGLDKTKLTAKIYLYDGARQTALAAPFSLIQQTQKIAPNDSHIQYVGRWSGNASLYQSDWIRPYFKITFSGTSVKINLTQSVNLSVTLDGVETQYTGAVGLVELGANLSPYGTHTLRVAGLIYPDIIKFDGLYLDDVGTLGTAVTNPNELEFIGDSITAWNNGYSWLVGENLGIESSRIAWPGIALVDGFGYYQVTPPLYGMQSAYLKIGMPGYGSGTTGDWNFAASPYTPNLVVINLGTNDGAAITGNSVFLSNFQSAYAAFIRNVRAKFPSAEIFVLRAFSIHYADVNTAATNAVQSVITGGDTKVHYVDTSAWGVEIGSDGIHPTDAGHVTITNKLVPILKPYLRSVSPTIVSTNSVSFVSGAANSFNVQATGSPAATYSATALPSGLTLNSISGVLSGTPTQTGTTSVTLTASNGTSGSGMQAFTLIVQSDSGSSTTQTLSIPIAAGTGTVCTNTVLSVPLLPAATAAGQMLGLVTAVTDTTVTNTNAGWTAGQLSNVATPYLIRFTSGAALGRSFLLSTATANTATTVTLDSSELTTLTSVGVSVGDSYQLVPCPTLLSRLGTPGTTGVLGGTSYNTADQVQVLSNGAWKKYYYSTTQNSWRMAGFESAANNLPLPPNNALLYGRLANSPLTLTVSGLAPDSRRVVTISKTGLSLVANGWATNVTLASTGLNTLPGWVSHANPQNADIVSLWSGYAWKKYFHDGTNWRLAGFNTLANSAVINAGSGFLVTRVTNGTGSAALIQNLP